MKLVDPTFFIYMVTVDPTVDQQLIKSAQRPEDGNIRIHSQTYSSFHMTILANQATFEYVIPIKVSTLKAVYFTFSPTTSSNLETLIRQTLYLVKHPRHPTIGSES